MSSPRRGVARTFLATLTVIVALTLVAATSGTAGAQSASAAPAALSAPAARSPISVGTLTLRPCETSPLAWCTTVDVPFDYTDPGAGTTSIYFEWFPATGPGSATGTVLTVQGGPGYPSTDYRDDYLAMLGPVTQRRNVLIVDLRGTGRSDAVNCHRLQTWTPAKGNQAYIDAVGACGTHLNTLRKRADGSAVRGAELYTTANAARDVARLLTLLRTGKVDLYGDSYGTYFGQVFTSRYASMLRSVTLDAAYPVLYADPFYPDAIVRSRIAFNVACRRAAACAAATNGPSWQRIGALAAALRTKMVTGTTFDPAGDRVTVTVDVDTLIQLIGTAGADSGVYRDLDAAIRAYLDAGDATPLLHLAAQEIDPSDSGPVKEFSAGLYVANVCNDYLQPFSYAGSYDQRVAQYRAAVAALAPNSFAPFTVAEWTTSTAEEFDACLRWPTPQVDDPPIVSGTPIAPASVPVLVLSGELDSLTTPEEGQRVASHMGPSARWVQIGNMIHVSAMLDYVGCAEGLVRGFIQRPNSTLDTACASAMPEVHTVGVFAQSLADVVPAEPTAGNKAAASGRRLAAVAAAALGDSIWRSYYAPGDTGRGLRGGSWSITAGDAGYDVVLTNVRWTEDTTVSGTGTWDRDTGEITATLVATGPGPLSATVTVAYHDYEPGAVAVLTGTAGGKRLAARTPAP